ncbi:hypothetical protein K440DRAFT_657279 [Wilcoxina mikolae CBS 423.85]|nr:hypothetical protein K440DRAFT_657279 [Wilcoxina mikolae CBS 423.85]
MLMGGWLIVAIGDFVAVAQMAYGIYTKLIRPAINAPKEYKELVNDLGTLYAVLRLSHDDFGAELEKADIQKRDTLKGIIEDIYRVLGDLKKLQEKIHPQKTTKSFKTLWKGFAWAAERPTLVELRTKINEKIIILHYYRTGIGFSTVITRCQRIEDLLKDMLPNQTDQPQKANTAGQSPVSQDVKSLTHPTPPPTPTGEDGSQPNVTSTTDNTLENILEERRKVVATILKALNHNRPLCFLGRIAKVPPVPFNKHPELPSLFQESVEQYDEIVSHFQWKSPHCPRFWLRKAAWWILKSRKIRSLYQDGSSADQAWLKTWLPQAHLDLWKASWLVYGIVIKNKEVPVSEDRMLLEDLLKDIKKDFAFLHSLSDAERQLYDFSSDLTAQVTYNYSLQEGLAEFELNYGDPMDVDPTLRADRWYTLRNYGTPGIQERVLFRTFVRATISSECSTDDDYDDPWYMLVLWMMEGEVTEDDLQPAFDGDENSLWRNISFPGYPVKIRFLNQKDRKKLWEVRKLYFQNVWDSQRLRDGEEEIFRSTVQVKDHHYQHLDSLTNPQLPITCELRIYETAGDQGWNSTRRALLAGTGNTSDRTGLKLWCISYFMPLSRVRLMVDGRYMTIRWSDCWYREATKPEKKSIEKKEAGSENFPPRELYRYNPSKPNIRLDITLETPEEAQNLRSTILGLSFKLKERRLRYGDLHCQPTPSITGDEKTITSQATSSTADIPERRIYFLHGRTPEGEVKASLYHGLFLVRKQKSWEYADLHLLPRIIDVSSRVEETDGTLSLIFYNMRLIDYIPNEAADASERDQPRCKERRREDELVVGFPDVLAAKDILEYICESRDQAWELQSWSICEIQYQLPSLKRWIVGDSCKENEAEVSVWKEHLASTHSSSTDVAGPHQANYQMVIRWNNSSMETKWFTGSVSAVGFWAPPENVISGSFLDTGSMRAFHQSGTPRVKSLLLKPKHAIYASRLSRESRLRIGAWTLTPQDHVHLPPVRTGIDTAPTYRSR